MNDATGEKSLTGHTGYPAGLVYNPLDDHRDLAAHVVAHVNSNTLFRLGFNRNGIIDL